ncbi:uncharacterized protein LOC114364589 [Ostrinia furnacalis]|uniref:uncharacterized protein LOC114364589 n=1 Tax=Ostrinia furnacalis TaxID=93504 RepID=UPI00103BC9F0|nr:uncharacterized protein LOC114364589 [Ostrinia furnacalis]
MKFALSLVILSVLAFSEAGLLKDPSNANSSRANLNHGSIQPGDQLLYRTIFRRNGIAWTVQTHDFVYQGNETTSISAVIFQEVGNTQHANPRVIAGGRGFNHVTVRVQTARGWGFTFQVDIWGQ